ncbi:signal peptidase I [Paenibacillus turicensis]|uniref:signal peptidase I n=1 Tax=Paenibacillus turicensis TaxID=160487 RepID=UPI003D2C0965
MPEEHRDEVPQKKWRRDLFFILKTCIIAFVIMLLLNQYVFNLTVVKGQSMLPTLANQERMFIDKVVYYFYAPQHGEIVVLKDPTSKDKNNSFLVKRIIGVPGDQVEIKNHKLYVNNEIVNEPYTDVQIEDEDMPLIKLQVGEFFVMGDNRHAGKSKDSRYFGSVQREDIVGRAEFIIWPIYTIRSL